MASPPTADGAAERGREREDAEGRAALGLQGPVGDEGEQHRRDDADLCGAVSARGRRGPTSIGELNLKRVGTSGRHSKLNRIVLQ